MIDIFFNVQIFPNYDIKFSFFIVSYKSITKYYHRLGFDGLENVISKFFNIYVKISLSNLEKNIF